jgi:hypothetical protein
MMYLIVLQGPQKRLKESSSTDCKSSYSTAISATSKIQGNQSSTSGSSQSQSLLCGKEIQGGNPTPLYFDLFPNANTVSPSGDSKPTAFRPLQYYFETGMKSTKPIALNKRPSRIMNLRDMLDEGDGVEGDVNARVRNDQWKPFVVKKEFGEKNHLCQKHQPPKSNVSILSTEQFMHIAQMMTIVKLDMKLKYAEASDNKRRHVAAAGLAYGSDNHLLVGSKIETL